MSMQKIKSLLLLMVPMTLGAQSIEGTSYMLPKNGLRITVKVEKTTYTPGRLCQYASRYMRATVQQEGATTYRIIGMEMDETVEPDPTKKFTLITDKKHSIDKVCCSPSGQLLAINTDAQPYTLVERSFTATRPVAQPNPTDFMTEEILSAGSTAKMAELTAREIYDIRESHNALSRGEADNMPKDGTQLAMMYDNMNRQEKALSQLFYGTTVKDTTWTQMSFMPMKEGSTILFRFSKHYGLVEADDLSGEPYNINISDQHTAVAPAQPEDPKKEDKNDIGLRVSLPSKIKATVTANGQTYAAHEMYAAQFGYVDALSGELFGKKQSSEIVLDPKTGSVKSIKALDVK